MTVTLSSLPNPLLNWKYKIISKTSVSISCDIDTQISNIPTLGYDVIYIYLNSIIENTITTTGIEYTLKNLFPGKEYTIHLKSINAFGGSETTSITIIFYVGIIPSKVLKVKRDERN